MIDKETIGKVFESTVAGIVPCYLSEAETEDYPFLVYDQTVTPLITKDGVCSLSSSLAAVIVAEDPNQAETIAEAVAAAVRIGMADYGVFPQYYTRDCTNGIWEYTLTWTIRQNSFTAGSGSGSGSGSGA